MNNENPESPILTVDGVVFQLIDGQLAVLLIRRGFEPFLGVWALPGVYIGSQETSRQALDRALTQKTGISLKQVELVEQPYAFDMPKRDPRGYVVTVMYIGLAKGNVTPGTHKGMNNAQNPQFMSIAKLPKLAYDHDEIVRFAVSQLRALAMSTNAVGALLPKHFTLSQLQSAYEAIFCKQLDKRNFRKRILALDFLKDTGKMLKDGAHRPAKLYSLAKVRVQSYSPVFDFNSTT
jgi:8-oxo-dGTP diphosphatase